MMDTSTCTTIVLVLLWLYLCCQALGSLFTLIDESSTTEVLPTTTTLSTLLLGLCLWQFKKAGYLVQPMTWYHWVLLVLLVLLQIVAVVMEYLCLQGSHRQHYEPQWKYPIYGIAVVLLGILGGTLLCGWKCNLFCRPCCKSQYICYGSAVVVLLVVLLILALTAAMVRFQHGDGSYGNEADIEKATIKYLSKMVIPIIQCYTTAVIWNTLLKLPYIVQEVVALLVSALAVASLLAVVVPDSTLSQVGTKGYPLLAVHLVTLGITWYCLEYKQILYWSKDYMCFGVLAVVLLVTLIGVSIISVSEESDDMKYTLLGYSIVLMIPTLWYAYRCGLLTWCFPKKKNLQATDSADNTTAETDIANES